MTKKLGISINFGNEERYGRIKNLAKQYNYDIEIYDYNATKLTAEQLDSCDVFFGMPSPALIEKTTNLKWLHTSMAGVDKYATVKKFQDDSIVLTNSSGAFGITISEHVICTLLMLMRRIPEYFDLQKQHGWGVIGEIKSIMNSTITIVGMGDIGENVAKRAKAMGAKVRGVRRNVTKKSEYVDEMYPTDKMIDAIKDADAVVLCLPQTNQTKNIFGKQEFEAMKSDAYIINVGRGSAIEQDELIKALNSGKIGGASIDVFATEPLPKDDELWNAKNIIITPHVSGNTSLPLTCDIAIDIFCKNFEHYMKGEKLEHIVDIKQGY